MTGATVPERKRWRPRISLLTALLLMTILGMGIVVVQLWQEVGPLRAEMRQLRDEVGRLSIDDPSKISAIEVRTNEPRTWNWRIWIPNGKPVNARVQIGNIPRSGIPIDNSNGEIAAILEPGEQWLTLQLQRDANNDSWIAVFETARSHSSLLVNENDRWWLWPQSVITGEGAGFSITTAKDAEKEFVIKRYRVSDKTNNSSVVLKDDKPTAGFIIWLDK